MDMASKSFTFTFTFTFLCRSNLSYGRYWEGRTQLQQMTARLSDAIRTTLNFDKTAVPRTGATQEEIEEHQWFCDTFVHLISLFHGVALATLRGDYNMENLVVRLPSSRIDYPGSVSQLQSRHACSRVPQVTSIASLQHGTLLPGHMQTECHIYR